MPTLLPYVDHLVIGWGSVDVPRASRGIPAASITVPGTFVE
jgi:hypothetical protein